MEKKSLFSNRTAEKSIIRINLPDPCNQIDCANKLHLLMLKCDFDMFNSMLICFHKNSIQTQLNKTYQQVSQVKLNLSDICYQITKLVVYLYYVIHTIIIRIHPLRKKILKNKYRYQIYILLYFVRRFQTDEIDLSNI